MSEATYPPPGKPYYGLLAEFTTPQSLLDAVERAQAEGYSKLDAFTPYPVEAISEAVMHHKKSKVSLLVLLGGLSGAAIAYTLQYWTSTVVYPMNIGNRPLHSWPAFIPATFELTILLASFAAIFSLLFLNKLPQPYHPLFNVKSFERASVDRCFLVIESEDPKFDLHATRSFLEGLDPNEVTHVDW